MRRIKLNRFDILLIVIIVLLIAGTCVKFFVLDQDSAQTTTGQLTYQMKIENIRQYSVDALQVGDTVYDNEGKSTVGTISKVEVTPARAVITRTDGTVTVGTTDEHYDVVLTITADGKETDIGYKIGSYELSVNETGTFFTKYCIWYSTITQLG